MATTGPGRVMKDRGHGVSAGEARKADRVERVESKLIGKESCPIPLNQTSVAASATTLPVRRSLLDK
jgi:hypothetical protein